MFRTLAIASAIMVGSLATANAASYTVTQALPLSLDGNATILAAPFNTALGTLTGVTLTVNGTETVIALANTLFPLANPTGTITFGGGLLVPGNTATDGTIGTGTFSGDARSVTGSGNIHFVDQVSLTPYALGLYTGQPGFGPSGLVDVQLNLDYPTFNLAGGGQLFPFSISYGLNGTYEETFTYNPVPEPATITLLLTGMIGLVAVRRSKALSSVA